MPDDLIPVIEIARIHNVRKSRVFKILKRLDVEKTLAPTEHSRGQKAALISRADYERVRVELERPRTTNASDSADDLSSGVFYLVQLEPDHDPNRIKVGYATNIDERLRSHRTAAPFLKLVKMWPCRAVWEKTAIDSVCSGFERVHTEVFRAPSIEDAVTRCDRFFEVMPDLKR